MTQERDKWGLKINYIKTEENTTNNFDNIEHTNKFK